MARPRADAPRRSRALLARVLSALVLVPVAVAAVYFDIASFAALIAVAVAAAAWEWTRMCAAGQFGPAGWVLAAWSVAALVPAALGAAGISLAAMLAGGGAAALAARLDGSARPGWMALFALAVGVPGIALVWLRDAQGPAVAMALMGAVWATDIGAYASGKLIGGARLAPRISPGKTWAGLCGGIACAIVWGAAYPHLLGAARPLPLILAAAGATAVLAQLGDLAVSVAKRKFGLKDASGLIPGHGGVLDRIDGLLTTGPALALLLLVLNNHGRP